MDQAHDAVAHGARHVLADLMAGAITPSDARYRLDVLVAEHGPLHRLDSRRAVGPARRFEACRKAFSLTGTLLGFGYAWGDLFPILLDIRLLDQGVVSESPPTSDLDLSAGHAFLLQIARSHLAALADGADLLGSLAYDEALERLDGLHPPFTAPSIMAVPLVPRRVSYAVVLECLRQIAWHGVDPVGLLSVRDLLDAAWAAEVDVAVVGGAS